MKRSTKNIDDELSLSRIEVQNLKYSAAELLTLFSSSTQAAENVTYHSAAETHFKRTSKSTKDNLL
jgi:hypothetical protein